MSSTEQEELPGYSRLVHSHQQRNQGCVDLSVDMGIDVHIAGYCITATTINKQLR